MAVSIFPIPATTSVPNWQHISTITASGGSVTFSGLSGYSKYRIGFNTVSTTSSGNNTIALTVNSVAPVGTQKNTSTTGVMAAGPISAWPGAIGVSAAQWNGTIEIDGANQLTIKRVDAFIQGAYSTVGIYEVVGIIPNLSLVTSIAITANGTATFSGGTMYLEGAN